MTDSIGPTISTPVINPINPGSDEDTTITVSIDDVDGLKNTTLFWEYTVNNTKGNVTMSSVPTLLVSSTGFTDTGSIDDNQAYGNYSFVASEGDVINRIEIHVTKGQEKNNLTYVKIELKNSSTGNWEIEREDGNIGSTIDLDPSDLGLDYVITEVVVGIRIFVISHEGTFPLAKAPNLDLSVYKLGYQGIIPAARQPTTVSYYITAFDSLDNPATSGTYSFLMDWTPTVTIHNLPNVLPPNQDYILNVSVSDNDGVDDIDDSSVIAYYSLESETEWNSINLMWLLDDFSDPTRAHYNGTIPSSSIANIEANLIFKVNASDQLGRTGTSGNNTIILDNLNPRVTNINIEGAIIVPGLENVTYASSDVNITATFFDPAGISNVSFYYSIPNDTTPLKKLMVNTTLKAPTESITDFFVTLPAANMTTFVEYFFETSDYLGNSGNTSSNVYYADGSSPLLETLINHPLFISNNTDTTILFNATDYTGIENIQATVWYSFDEGTTWESTAASRINYIDQVDYQQAFVFDPTYLPFLIQDNSTTNMTLEVVRGARIDSAILSVGFSHELSTDLRIWILLEDNRRFLVFDRQPVPDIFDFTVDLITLGLKESDFNSQNFTLQIQDFSDLYSGSITSFEIELMHHKIPLGYQFMAKIPKTVNDTTVLLFVTLEDAFANIGNSSIFSYYSDGLPPNINVKIISSPLDLEKRSTILIEAEITDIGGIIGVDLYYKFTESDERTITSMVVNSDNMYVFDIPIPSKNGTLIYKIRAFDFAGLSSETPIYTVEFINGRVGRPGLDIGPLIILGGLIIILGTGVAVSIYFIRKRFLSASTELSE
jgi:hypothetical protein